MADQTTTPERGRQRSGQHPRSVADWVRERIRLGRLVPGQRLVEADIVRDTGASRSKVREALQRLESEGLVSIEEFRGASVKRLGIDEVRQIYRARMALEGLAAAEFAASGQHGAEAAAAGESSDELNQWEHKGNHDRFARLNDSWHRADHRGIRQCLHRAISGRG